MNQQTCKTHDWPQRSFPACAPTSASLNHRKTDAEGTSRHHLITPLDQAKNNLTLANSKYIYLCFFSITCKKEITTFSLSRKG